MLIIFTWASLAFLSLPSLQSAPTDCDSIKTEKQDTVSSKNSEIVGFRTSILKKQQLRIGTPINTLFGSEIDQQHLAGMADSLMKMNPTLKGPILKEMLIPTGPRANYGAVSGLELFHRPLEKESTFTPFEQMSLIAKRYAIYNPPDKSMKSYQIDIRSTIVWLSEVLK